MSLLKQLLLSVSVAMVGILLGTLALSIDSARSYLTEQLQSQSENAASSLSLSLSQPGNQDPVTRELLMAALFDTGQFAAIRLVAPNEEVLFERSTPRWKYPGVHRNGFGTGCLCRSPVPSGRSAMAGTR